MEDVNSKTEHVMPVLHQLHWLPVWQWIHYKLAVLVYKAVRSQLPQYLRDDCRLIPDISRRSHWSSYSLTCTVWRTHMRLGDRGFSRPWNSLPVVLQSDSISLALLRDTWKHCLSRAVAHFDCCLFFYALYKYSYLLTYLLKCMLARPVWSRLTWTNWCSLQWKVPTNWTA